jgi:hypothetical protein
VESGKAVSEFKRQQEMQKLWIELEWRRCATDEQYFLKEYVWIPSLEDQRGRVKFDLFDYQEELMSLMKNQRFIIALKARQIGFTTLGMAHALWLALFRPGATVLIVSETQKSSNKNLAQARLAYQFLPPWMKERGPKIKSDSSNGMSFEFTDGMITNLKASPATSGVFAGETATFVLWDEAALVEPASLQEDVLRTLLPCTDAGGSMMIISTARGAYNRFAKTYRSAKRGESQFVPFFQPWMVSPFMRCSEECSWCGGIVSERTPCVSRYDRKRREFADEPWRFFQEYPSEEEEAFRESGQPRFRALPPEILFDDMPYRGSLVWRNDTQIDFVPSPEGRFHFMELDPDPNGFYVVAGDPAQGIGKDSSTAHVLTFDDNNQPMIVAYYSSNTVQPTEYAADLDILGRFFAGREWAAKMAVEDQGGQGALPINELHKHLEYPNPYVHQSPGAKRARGARLFSFPMTSDRRKAVIDRLAKYLTPNDMGEIPLRNIHKPLRIELGQFVAQTTANGNIRYSADVGCHDDLVMSLAIGLWLLIEEYSEASPEAAIVEPTTWKPKYTLDLTALRSEREKAEREHEEQQRWMMESLALNTELIHAPRSR